MASLSNDLYGVKGSSETSYSTNFILFSVIEMTRYANEYFVAKRRIFIW